MTVDARYLLGLHAQTACIWEATARKPGNVHPLRSFDDTDYLDFLLSAAAVAPVLAVSPQNSVGKTVYDAIQATRRVVKTNTNLGMLLLLAPLTKAAGGPDLYRNLMRILDEIDGEDAATLFSAIRLAHPGGLGAAPEQDISGTPTLPFRQIMTLAANRDLIAQQYANGFREVFEEGAPAVLEGMERTRSMEGAVVFAHLGLMARHPDTLIARKRGLAEAAESAGRARAVIEAGWPDDRAGWLALADLDAWLRAAGHGRNPGTTADMIAASLFVLLHERRITLPSPLPWPADFDHD